MSKQLAISDAIMLEAAKWFGDLEAAPLFGDAEDLWRKFSAWVAERPEHDEAFTLLEDLHLKDRLESWAKKSEVGKRAARIKKATAVKASRHPRKSDMGGG